MTSGGRQRTAHKVQIPVHEEMAQGESRHYSQFLSLQIKARYEGLPTPVYGLQEVHHLS